MRPGRLLEGHIEVVFLQHCDGCAGGFDEEVVFARREPDELHPFLQLWIVQHLLVLFFPTWPGWLSAASKTPAAGDAKDAGTVNAHVAKFAQIPERDVQRLRSAHGKPGNGAAFLIGVNAIILFRVRHDVVSEIREELIIRSAYAVAAK